MCTFRRSALLCFAALSLVATLPAHAITMKECTAAYESAKKAGTLNGMKWSDFRTSQCNLGADHNGDLASPETADSPEKPATASIEVPQGVTFPRNVDSKFAAEPPARQRMKTCLEAYHANKSANTLNGLNWIQKGGGYYSICNARLKSSS